MDVLCKVLAVSRSGYYAWRDRPQSQQQTRRQKLPEKIRAVHENNRKLYGSPRICRALQARSQSVCENTVAKIMGQQRIRARCRRRFVPRTTDSAHAQPVAQNLLDRHFTAQRRDRNWAADIPYIPTDEGWLYLAGVIDLCSRRIIDLIDESTPIRPLRIYRKQ